MNGMAWWIRRSSGFAVAMLAACAAFAAAPLPASKARPQLDHVAQAVVEHVGGRRLILLGEMHGTREIPLLVETLVAHWSSDAPVVLGLEIARDEHRALAAYMASDGGAQARAALRARPWWRVRDDQHDGRRSEDMLEFVEAMRRLRAQGRDVALLAFDTPYDPADRNARDLAMAFAVKHAYEALPTGRVVMLTGNVHAMLERPAYLPAIASQPAGTYLRGLEPASIRIGARAGEFWGCGHHAPRCGPIPVGAAPPTSQPERGAYTFHAVLPKLTPARLVAPRIGAP